MTDEPLLSRHLHRTLAVRELDAEETIRFDTVGTRPARASQSSSPRVVVGTEDADIVVLHELGRGGMGEVLLGRQTSLEREVAIKRVRSERYSEDTGLDLLREGVVTGRLEHPNIVPVHLLGTDTAGRPILVMKRVEGIPWRKLIKEPAHPAWEATRALSGDPMLRQLEIFLEVCTAIAFAHARGIVHRDIKPDNVMIGSTGEVYVLDWGIATEIGTRAYAHADEGDEGLPVGTPSYLAPEMVQLDGVVDERTDVYLLGATLHVALTRRPRHGGTSLHEVFVSVMQSEPHAYGKSLPVELAAICNRATSLRPEDRYPSALALRDAVKGYLRHKGSIDLQVAAEARLIQLRCKVAELAKEPALDTPADELHRLFNESRFGFTQALREWPGNDAARSGLASGLELMARHAIGRHDFDMARALIAELAEPPTDLADALEAAVRAQTAERERVTTLKRLEHDLDMSAGWQHRALLMTGLAVLVSASLLLFVPFGGAAVFRLDVKSSLWMLIAVLALFSVPVVLFRRRVLHNAANRRAIAVMYIAAFAMIANRVVGIPQGASMNYVATLDLLMCACLSAVAAFTIHRRLAFAAGAYAVGTVICDVIPSATVAVFGATHVTAMVAAGLAWLGTRDTSG